MALKQFLTGSTIAVFAALGAAPIAVALPTTDVESQTLISQTNTPNGRVQVQGTVQAVQQDRGEITVNLEDGRRDIIYLGQQDITSLRLNEGEEITLFYEDDQAVALMRDGETVYLRAQSDQDSTGTSPDSTGTTTDRPDSTYQEDTQPTPSQSDTDRTQPQQGGVDQQTQPTTPQYEQRTSPQTTPQSGTQQDQYNQQQEPVRGLW